jgi:hypothetical protein
VIKDNILTISAKLLSDFMRFFTGNQSAYGVHEYKFTKKGEKEKGKSYTKVQPVTENLYSQHLIGETGIGIIPITGTTCNFSVLDVDIYGRDLNHIVDLIYKYNMPLVPFRTKSGGLHLYIFYAMPVKAVRAIQYMNYFKQVLGLDEKTEIFPKQATLNNGKVGNWINLPYFAHEKTKQYLINPYYKAMVLDEALIYINKMLQTEEKILEIINNLPLNDAPPCLQYIYLTGNTEYRNNYLFSLASFFKAKYGDDFEFKVMDANSHLQTPLPTDEISKTIIAAHKKKDYTYKCNEDPICKVCNKAECRNRKYGIGGEEISTLSFEDLTQYKTDPPFYAWRVNGKELKFYTENEIIAQKKFRVLCFRELHVLPNILSGKAWTKIINRALDNLVIKDINDEDDISPGTLFKEYLTEFLEHQTQAVNKEQIAVNRVYKDKKIKCYIFKPKNLFSFLIGHKGFRFYGPTQMQDRLRELGGQPERYYLSKEAGTTRVWTLPFKGLKKFINEPVKDISFDIDFQENYDKEPF